jgi:hypothetical protein
MLKAVSHNQRAKPKLNEKPTISRLEYAPPLGQEDRPPLLANNVQITGGSDALVLTFYHISPNTMMRVFGHQPISHGQSIERNGETAIVRSEPIARIALPFTVALDMLAEMVGTAIQGVPDIQSSVENAVERLSEAMKQAEALKGNPKSIPEGSK